MKFTNFLLFIATLTCTMQSVQAATIGFDVVGGGTTQGIAPTDFSTGLAFTVNNAVTIESLLFYDKDSDGIQAATDIIVSIFVDNGSLTPVLGLTATFNNTTNTVFAGNNPSDGRWLEIDLPNTLLGIGSYTIVAQGIIDGNIGDTVIAGATNINSSSELSFLGSRVEAGIVNPTVDAFNIANSYFGPNFTYTVANGPSAVPVPAAFWLFGTGFVGLMGWSKRSRKSS